MLVNRARNNGWCLLNLVPPGTLKDFPYMPGHPVFIGIVRRPLRRSDRSAMIPNNPFLKSACAVGLFGNVSKDKGERISYNLGFFDLAFVFRTMVTKIPFNSPVSFLMLANRSSETKPDSPSSSKQYSLSWAKRRDRAKTFNVIVLVVRFLKSALAEKAFG